MRILICTDCATKPWHQNQHPEDAAMGFKFRRVEISKVKKPAVHHITVNGKDQPEMQTIICDGCGNPILDGSPAVAITQWRDGQMGPWEKEYSQ